MIQIHRQLLSKDQPQTVVWEILNPNPKPKQHFIAVDDISPTPLIGKSVSGLERSIVLTD
jgi:hypothetical protein